MRPAFPLLLSLFVSLLLSPASAQAPAGFYDFEFSGPADVTIIPQFPGTAIATAHLRDISKDSPSNIVPGAPPTRALAHQVSFSAEIISANSQGWFITSIPSPVPSFAGDSFDDLQVKVLVTATATNPHLRIRLTAVMQPNAADSVNHTIEMLFRAKGLLGVQVIHPPSKMELAPREIGRRDVGLVNNGIYPIQVTFDVVANPCDLGVGLPGAVVMGPQGGPDAEKTVAVNVAAPADSFYYQSLSCNITLNVVSLDGSGSPETVTMIVKIDGFYVDPQWIINLAILAALLLLLILFIRRRKERLEERILGKPQKPWTIPVEQVYLRELKARDPRAWYVVRHYLMEEEYKSSLLWFHAYKAATKGDRKKERLILKQETTYESWKAKWAKAIAKPAKKADRYEAKLQRKLDRRAKKQFRKAKRKARKLSAKIKAANAKLQRRAMEKWQKDRAKAMKKGRPAPPEPVAAAPSLPPDPVQTAPKLAEHKWSKRAARYRRRMVRKQGNLEVKFEKADARYLARLRRKVSRIARKLDDPDFVAEHPLLQKA